MGAIAGKYLKLLQDRTLAAGITLVLPDELQSYLAEQCKGKGGARQLRRMVQEEVEGPLAVFLLGCSKKPNRIGVRFDKGKLSFECA